jgi:hypothetical protein
VVGNWKLCIDGSVIRERFIQWHRGSLLSSAYFWKQKLGNCVLGAKYFQKEKHLENLGMIWTRNFLLKILLSLWNKNSLHEKEKKEKYLQAIFKTKKIFTKIFSKMYKNIYPKKRKRNLMDRHKTFRIEIKMVPKNIFGLLRHQQLDKRCNQRQDGIYPMSGLREPYQYLIDLFCRIYGLKDCTIFKDSWILVAYVVEVYGWTFNWGTILSNTITPVLKKSKENQMELAPTFFIFAYLLDCICALIYFPGMDWHENDTLPIYRVCQKTLV